jgi:di/tricarboxylate transporter
MLGILKSVSNNLKLEPYNKWTVSVGVSMAVVCCVGNVMMPFNMTFHMYGGLVGGAFGWVNDLNMGIYTLQQLIAGIVLIILCLLVTKFLIRPRVDFSALNNLEIESESGAIKFNKTMSGALLTIVVLVIVVSIPSLVPQESIVYKIFNLIGISGAFAISCIILAFTKDSNGESLVNFADKLQKSTNWSMIIYLAVIFYIGNLMSDAGTGISEQIAVICKPLGALSPIILISLLGLICVLVTNVANNFVTCMILAPIGYAVLGFDSVYSDLMTVMVIVCSYIAVALPTASFGGIALSMQKDMLKSGQILRYGYLFSVLGFIGQWIGLLICQGMY